MSKSLNKHGEVFLRECREIIEECSKLSTPDRAARVAIFALCVILDGSGESIGPQYTLSVKDGQRDLQPVIFQHHNL